MTAYDVDWDAGTENRWDEHRDRFRPDPKPLKRHRASKREWETIRATFRNERCRVCDGPFESLHHIYPRGQGGDDVTVNLAPVCGSGTTGCHGKLEARDSDTRAELGRNLTDENIAYLRHRLGERAASWVYLNYAVVIA